MDSLEMLAFSSFMIGAASCIVGVCYVVYDNVFKVKDYMDNMVNSLDVQDFVYRGD